MTGEDDERFSDLMSDMDRRAPRDTRLPPDAGKRRTTTAIPTDEPTKQFVHPKADEPLLAFAPGLDRRSWQRLRRGRIAPEREVDLHGFVEEAARSELETQLAEATRARERCVCVVHGVGRHSERGPVLRDALPGWLADPAVARFVLGFAPAPGELGGRGATLVLLRKSAS
jgi:DNA-nicking Smr family endonuclease